MQSKPPVSPTVKHLCPPPTAPTCHTHMRASHTARQDNNTCGGVRRNWMPWASSDLSRRPYSGGRFRRGCELGLAAAGPDAQPPRPCDTQQVHDGAKRSCPRPAPATYTAAGAAAWYEGSGEQLMALGISSAPLTPRSARSRRPPEHCALAGGAAQGHTKAKAGAAAMLAHQPAQPGTDAGAATPVGHRGSERPRRHWSASHDVLRGAGPGSSGGGGGGAATLLKRPSSSPGGRQTSCGLHYTVQYIGVAHGELGILTRRQVWRHTQGGGLLALEK